MYRMSVMTFLLDSKSDLDRVKCMELGNKHMLRFSSWFAPLFLAMPITNLVRFHNFHCSIGSRFGRIDCWRSNTILRSATRGEEKTRNECNAGNCKIDWAAWWTSYGIIWGKYRLDVVAIIVERVRKWKKGKKHFSKTDCTLEFYEWQLRVECLKHISIGWIKWTIVKRITFRRADKIAVVAVITTNELANALSHF